MHIVYRHECAACGHVLQDADHGSCPWRNAAPPGEHTFTLVKYVPEALLAELWNDESVRAAVGEGSELYARIHGVLRHPSVT